VAIYRLNVQQSQLKECVEKGLFALARSSRMERGDILLLQLSKTDARAQGIEGARISHALVFDHAKSDMSGEISRRHWPFAGRVWSSILYSSAVLKVDPFSLEDLPLHRNTRYQAQANPVRIDDEDEPIISERIRWETARPIVTLDEDPIAELPIEPDPAIRALVECYAVKVAIDRVLVRFPDTTVEEMAHNHPGFDLLVRKGNRVHRYIEVKGTRQGRPVFHMTENERRFSSAFDDHYEIVVVYSIDLKEETHEVVWAQGEMRVGETLHPANYTGLLQMPGDGCRAGRTDEP